MNGVAFAGPALLSRGAAADGHKRAQTETFKKIIDPIGLCCRHVTRRNSHKSNNQKKIPRVRCDRRRRINVR